MVILASLVRSLSTEDGFWFSFLVCLPYYAFVVHHCNFVLDDCILYVRLNFVFFLPRTIQKLSEQRMSNELYSNLYCAHGYV